jgi:predicted secreted hydrolase
VKVRRTASLAIAGALVLSLSAQTQAKPGERSAFTRAIEKAACEATREPGLAPRRFAFPRDDGAHDGYAVEWWRSFGRVADESGKLYDFSVNVSRFGVEARGAMVDAAKSRWAARDIITTAYELLDEQTREVVRGTFVDREGSLGAKASRDELAVVDGALHFASAGVRAADARRFTLSLHDSARTNALLIDQMPMKAALPLGPGGVMRTGSCVSNAAYAYAYPRNATHGVLRFHGVDHRVTGSTWIEHEFAHRELAALDVGWNRFEVQFDDGRDVDARFTRDAYGAIVATSGVFVAADGTVTYLSTGDAGSGLPPGSDWVSTQTNTSYPSLWLFGVKPGHLGLAVNEVDHDQEDREPGRTPYYWGAIDVEKFEPPGGDHGHGFVELTGYAGPRAL